MHGHLVTVKVGIECGTYQRMKLDCFSFNQNRLKCLNTETMQCRRTVQHNRVLLDDIFQYIPDLRIKLFHHLLGVLDIVCHLPEYKLLHDKWLEQLNGHFLRKTTLINLQFRSIDDNGTSGIIDTFSEEVLTEPSVLSLQHVGQRFQCAVSRACNRSSSSSVIDQSIYSLLQHSLLISDDDIRCSQIQESLQTVVPVDDSAIKIVQIGGRESAAIQLYHRAEIRRNNRYAVQNHPLRAVFGLTESFYNLKSLDDTGSLLTACLLQLCCQLFIFLVQIDLAEKLLDCLSSHSDTELIRSVRLKRLTVLTL